MAWYLFEELDKLLSDEDTWQLFRAFTNDSFHKEQARQKGGGWSFIQQAIRIKSQNVSYGVKIYTGEV